MQAQINRAIQEIADRKNAPDWASRDNLLAKVEAIRLKAYQELLTLGFDEEELHLDVSLMPQEDMCIFHLAKELGWKSRLSWYEPPAPTEGGDITIYYEPEEQAW